MNICYSEEAKAELQGFRNVDRDTGIALEACIEMAALEPSEFEGEEGFSIRKVQGLWRKGILVYRLKYEAHIFGIRVLFFVVPEKACIFITGFHRRGELGPGNEYEFHREPFIRAQKYWALRRRLCQ
jgi:hypothetical protein